MKMLNQINQTACWYEYKWTGCSKWTGKIRSCPSSAGRLIETHPYQKIDAGSHSKGGYYSWVSSSPLRI